MSHDILVIDDEKPIRDAFLLALEENYQVETVSSGEEGLARLKEKRYGLIFLDLKMPGMNGVETLIELRKLDAEVPVYIVTAYYNEYLEQMQNLANTGVTFEIVNKPVGQDQIAFIAKENLSQENLKHV